MRRLVHEERARVFNVRVPSTKVIGAMIGIEQVLEIHRVDPADGAGRDQFLHACPERRPAIVERDAKPTSARFHRVHDRAAFLRVGRHRFLGDHVTAGEERADDVVGVCRIHRADEDLVGPFLRQHVVEAVGLVRGNGVVAHAAGEELVVVRHSRGAQVA